MAPGCVGHIRFPPLQRLPRQAQHLGAAVQHCVREPEGALDERWRNVFASGRPLEFMSRVRRAILPSIVLSLAVASLAACRDRERHDPRGSASDSREPSTPASKADRLLGQVTPFDVHWKPETGRGDVVVRLASGDQARICFHCGFEGYTGGLLIGGYNGSGFGLYPRKPIRGFRAINVFCAQDESIWDLGESREYSYGWSENFGRGVMRFS